MSLAVVYSRASAGIHAPSVSVEVHLSRGLPGFHIVGLPEKAVNESKDRVRSALLNCGFQFPAKRIVVNLAPADLRKEGGRFDLPMAIGILLASEQLPAQSIEHIEIAGELELSGKLRSVKGILPFAIATQKALKELIIPKNNVKETILLKDLTVYPAEHFLEVCEHFKGPKHIAPIKSHVSLTVPKHYPDLSDVKGQHFAKRALEIAAAGSHSLLFSGPPGAGKTLLASRLPSILPPMQTEAALEVATIYSISSQGFDHKNWSIRPFRSPHHTASGRALTGGGNPPQPGEISLAHQGVLFLDELPEFPRYALEALREPIEAGKITISRASTQVEFPAQFQFIAAMNPCPCGYATVKEEKCRCTYDQIERYQARISGPLFDRIDMHVPVLPLSYDCLLEEKNNEELSSPVAKRVLLAHEFQLKRNGKSNAWLTSNEIVQSCEWTDADRNFFTKAIERLQLSARAYYRTLKLARTIADLSQSSTVKREHLEEALCFRPVIEVQ